MKKIRGTTLCFMLIFSLLFLTILHSHAENATNASRVDFTFEGVAVETFVKLVGELTDKRFVIGDDVSGEITVVSPRVSHEEVFPLFLSILDASGFAVREEEGFFRIMRLEERTPRLATVLGPDADIPESGTFTKVFQLEHVTASDVSNLLEPATERGGAVRPLKETNHILVTDTAPALRRMASLLAELDRPGLERVMEVVPLEYAQAEELARQLNVVLAESITRAEELVQRLPARGDRPDGRERSRAAHVVPVPHANRLIVTGVPSQVQDLLSLIAEMDVDVPTGQGRLHAIFLRHLNSDEAAETLTELLSQRQERAEGSDRRSIAIQSSPSNNALLVDASPGDFEVVRNLIEQMDELPEQIHIGVMIVEVSDTDGLQLGTEFAALDAPTRVGDTVVQGGFNLGDASGIMNVAQEGVFPRGLSFGVAEGTSVGPEGQVQVGFPALLNIDAFRKANRFRILSETSLQSQNNREATVSVVNEIPILTSEITGGTGASRDVIQNIERMDVGIKLQITPHSIPGGLIRMALNPSIEAVVESGPEGQFAPTIAKREVETTVTVENGRTIVIAGLTRRDERENERSVPFLGSIPVLRWLFTRTDQETERNDLLILVTPTIVSSVEDQEAFRNRWQEKTGLPPHESE